MAAQPALVSPDLPSIGLPPVRLLKVPEVAPPFDGAAPPPAAPAPLAILPAAAAPAAAVPAPMRVRTVTAPADRTADGTADRGWTGQFAQLLVESLAGARPLRQLLPWLAGGAPVQLRRLAPAFGCGQRPRVVRVLAGWPSDSVAELTVIVRLGPRTRALAARLEAVRSEPSRSEAARLKAAHPEAARPEAARSGEGARPGQPARWLCTDIEAA
ncbi:MAG: hypothetical protein J2P26_03715 [Nocardiopsaceae bacterium]|nr:hypothetical protein [Nocardiopsaceae bacterium]